MHILKKTFLIFSTVGLLLLPLFVSAQTTPQNTCEEGKVCLENPIGSGQKGTVDATDVIATVIKGALGIVGALTLLMLVWGGFEWLTSAGNPEKVKAGTQTMLWAIIGVVLVFASYLLLSTFTTYLTVGN